MNDHKARTHAEQARPFHSVPADAELVDIERRYIELAGPDPTAPAPVRDLLAWVARFENENGWMDLAIDDHSGDVVRVERSRGLTAGS